MISVTSNVTWKVYCEPEIDLQYPKVDATPDHSVKTQARNTKGLEGIT